jgi:hypothetical protein
MQVIFMALADLLPVLPWEAGGDAVVRRPAVQFARYPRFSCPAGVSALMIYEAIDHARPARIRIAMGDTHSRAKVSVSTPAANQALPADLVASRGRLGREQ